MTAPAVDAADGPIEVWGIGTPRTLRVYWALRELGLPLVSHPVRTRTADMQSAEFLEVSPGGKIPAIRSGALTLVESGAIVDYLFALADAEAADAGVRARIARWSYFALTELDATALYVLRRHRGLPEVYGASEAACAAAEQYFARQIAQVDTALADGRSFLVGRALSQADIHVASCCAWAQREAIALPPRVSVYFAALTRRPAYRAAAVDNRTARAV